MKWVRDNGGHPTTDVGATVDAISSGGGTPWWSPNGSATSPPGPSG